MENKKMKDTHKLVIHIPGTADHGKVIATGSYGYLASAAQLSRFNPKKYRILAN